MRRRLRRLWTVGALALLSLFFASAALFAYFYVVEKSGTRLICLMYHRFVTDDEFRMLHGTERIYSMSLSKFEQQLAWMREHHYQSITMDDALAFARGECELPEHSVLITIDDGCESAGQCAGPLLRRYGYRATLFVTTDPTAYVFDLEDKGQERLTDDELCRLDADVFEVGAHGVHHRPLRDLPDAQIAAELRESRRTLELATGRPIRHMSVPGNWYDERVLRIAREAGFEGVCTSDPGSVGPGSDPLHLPRMTVSGHQSMRAFCAEFDPLTLARRRFIWTCRNLPDRIVGARFWHPIRDRVAALLPSNPLSPYHATIALLILLVLAATPRGVMLLMRLHQRGIARADSDQGLTANQQ